VARRALLVSCFAYSSTLKMEATCFSETTVDFQLTTRRLFQITELFSTYIADVLLTQHFDIYHGRINPST
jgi:hypothetical protein